MSIKEFFQTLDWRATLQVAAIRIAFASLIWPALFVILGNTNASAFFPQAFEWVLLLAAFMAIAIPAIGLARANVPFVGVAALPAWLVVVADPFVKLLHAKRPDLVPVDEFKLINPPVLAVFDAGISNVENNDVLAMREEDPASTQYLDESRSTDSFEEVHSNNDSIREFSVHRDSESYQDAQRIYEDALQVFEEGDKRQGLLRAIEAIKVSPHHIDANLFIASALCRIDPIEHAEQVFRCTSSVLNVEPNNEKAKHFRSVSHFEIGKQAWDAEDWTQATASFIEAYRLDPTIEHLAGALAHCAEKGDNLPDAIEAFEDRLNEQPDDIEARQMVGRSYVKLGISKDARSKATISQEDALNRGEQYLRSIIEHDPKNIDANYWLATVYVMSAQDEKVKEIIDILRPVSPDKAGEIEELLS